MQEQYNTCVIDKTRKHYKLKKKNQLKSYLPTCVNWIDLGFQQEKLAGSAQTI